MQPYDFGYRVGAALEKRADNSTMPTDPNMPQPRSWGGFAKELAVGEGGVVDPMKRGLGTHMLAYSNPFTGVPTAVGDTAQHLYNGRYLSALQSVGEGALSFLPGFGFAGRAAAKGITAGGKALTNVGMRSAGKMLGKADDALMAGRQIAYGANNMAGQAVQKAMPLTNKPGMMNNMRNYVASNPLPAAAGGLGPLDPLSIGALARGEGMMRSEFRQPQLQSTTATPATPPPMRQPMGRPNITPIRRPIANF